MAKSTLHRNAEALKGLGKILNLQPHVVADSRRDLATAIVAADQLLHTAGEYLEDGDDMRALAWTTIRAVRKIADRASLTA